MTLSGPAAPSDATAAVAFVFRLYVSAATPVSSRAIVNTRRFCDSHLAGRYVLDILNIADNVAQATADQIIASPTLLRVLPLPPRRFIGDMSNTERLLRSLGGAATNPAL